MKLVLVEAESEALQRYLADVPRLVTTTFAAIEVPRAARRAVGEQGVLRAEEALRDLLLLACDARLERAARDAMPPELRSVDALHLASMLRLADALDAAVVYDPRLGAAARAAGIRVEAPGQAPAP